MDGMQEDVSCPPLLPDYQTFMRGVDRGVQLLSYYNIGRRSANGGIFFPFTSSLYFVCSWSVMFGHPSMLSQEEGRVICLIFVLI